MLYEYYAPLIRWRCILAFFADKLFDLVVVY